VKEAQQCRIATQQQRAETLSPRQTPSSASFSTWCNSVDRAAEMRWESALQSSKAGLTQADTAMETGMELYVGLDVSLKQTAICVVDGNGKIISERMVVSDPDAIADFVRAKAAGAIRVGLETGPTATWLWSELKQRGLPVICIDARHAKAALKMQINKSDRNDAFGIARIMQTGWFKAVHVNARKSCH
jgi:hypothetical protein